MKFRTGLGQHQHLVDLIINMLLVSVMPSVLENKPSVLPCYAGLNGTSACFFCCFFSVMEDKDEMYDSLINGKAIDVVMEDIFIGIESMKIKDKTQQMSIAKFIGRNRGYGVAYSEDLFMKGISDCLSRLIKFRYDDVLNITRNYIKANTV